MMEIIKQLVEVITSFTNQIIDYLKENKKWKLKIYFLNQLVCTKRLDSFKDVSDIFKKPYICKVHKKHIFKTLTAQVVLLPNKALFKDEVKKEIHVNCIIYEGVGTSEL